MKVKKIHENALNLFAKCSLTKGVPIVDIMTKTQRERMMKFANNKKGKPPIWHDDVPWNGYRNDVLQFTNE